MVFRTRADAIDSPISASDAVKDAVGTMVRQFADPMAFFRELVQNSIDAGASVIHVRLRYDGDGKTLVVAVQDDGAGMDLETIERCLLVLFRSSKDKDPAKIGKFGVGFFSVFAVNPTLVRVDTGTGADGFRVDLRPDFTWEVTESAARKGTVVSLTIPMREGEARSFVERSIAALDRWCPHIEVPLHLLSTVRGGEVDKRVDRPFGIEGPLVELVRTPSAHIALTVAAEGRAAFYKRGILLYECPNTFFDGCSFKVESSSLVHTVSRDNIKRDGAFNSILDAIRRAIAQTLVPSASRWAHEALVEALGSSARDAASNERRAQAARALRSVAQLATQHEARVPLPLCDPLRTTEARVFLEDPSKITLFSASPDALTLALSRQGRPVLWTHALGDAHAEFLRSCIAASASLPHSRLCAIIPREDSLHPLEVDLLERLRTLLRAADIPDTRVVEFAGASSDALFLALDPGALASAPSTGLIVDAGEVHSKLYALFSNRACALNGAHPTWKTAVAAAAHDPGLAALSLARLVLLYTGKLDARRDRALFDAFASIDPTP
jgi:hypothetical protein